MKDRETKKLPIWKDKYDKMGVTPKELYMRQNRLCWLKPISRPDGSVIIFCTDGVDKAETSLMLNPTLECAKCMSSFSAKVVEIGIKNK